MKLESRSERNGNMHDIFNRRRSRMIDEFKPVDMFINDPPAE